MSEVILRYNEILNYTLHTRVLYADLELFTNKMKYSIYTQVYYITSYVRNYESHCQLMALFNSMCNFLYLPCLPIGTVSGNKTPRLAIQKSFIFLLIYAKNISMGLFKKMAFLYSLLPITLIVRSIFCHINITFSINTGSNYFSSLLYIHFPVFSEIYKKNYYSAVLEATFLQFLQKIIVMRILCCTRTARKN